MLLDGRDEADWKRRTGVVSCNELLDRYATERRHSRSTAPARFPALVAAKPRALEFVDAGGRLLTRRSSLAILGVTSGEPPQY